MSGQNILCRFKKRKHPRAARYHLPASRVLLLYSDLRFSSGGLVVAFHDPVSQDGRTLDAFRRIVDLLVVGADLFDGNASDLGCLLSSDFEISCVVVHVYLLFCLCSYCILKN